MVLGPVFLHALIFFCASGERDKDGRLMTSLTFNTFNKSKQLPFSQLYEMTLHADKAVITTPDPSNVEVEIMGWTANRYGNQLPDCSSLFLVIALCFLKRHVTSTTYWLSVSWAQPHPCIHMANLEKCLEMEGGAGGGGGRNPVKSEKDC